MLSPLDRLQPPPPDARQGSVEASGLPGALERWPGAARSSGSRNPGPRAAKLLPGRECRAPASFGETAMDLGVEAVRAAAVAIDLHRGHLDLSVATMPMRSEADA